MEYKYHTHEHSFAGAVTDAKQLIINQLTREIENLKRNSQETSILLEKNSNLEYTCELLTVEKERDHQDFDSKNNKNLTEIASLKAELEGYARLFSEKDNDCEKYLTMNVSLEQNNEIKMQQVFRLEEELRKKSEEIIHIEAEMSKLSRMHHEMENKNMYANSD